jgi:hypothetical protein
MVLEKVLESNADMGIRHSICSVIALPICHSLFIVHVFVYLSICLSIY